WPRVRIGEIVFRAGGPCARCIVTTTDQFTGARGKEPLRTLATYRRDTSDPSAVNFGQNLIHETKSGTLRVGDLVSIV
ncbi:MAG TPA: MOSC domain-containing protein, partial [Opitutus sp.]|nr:MOSC domain-containing protein [Opitutus sp.]